MDSCGVGIRVSSLLLRPRALPPAAAEDVYRAGEALALGLDMALARAGIKRTHLLAQRANRVAFQEDWAPPGGWGHFESLLLALDAGEPLPGAGEAIGPELRGRRLLIGAGRQPRRFPHLLGHAGSPWYYVPRDFPRPLLIPAPQPQSHAPDAAPPPISVGSVPALARELDALDALLAAHHLDPELLFPAPLLEATAVSLETGLVITLALQVAGPPAPLTTSNSHD